jgi:2-oxoisovalerate dehydrogenase E1 component
LKYKPADFNKLPSNSVVLCSFGDASCNHSTAQGAFNATQWIKHANLPLPLIWICEDNGIGISVPTPRDFIHNMMSHRPGITYLTCDGLNLADVYLTAQKANLLARKKGQCVFLHMKTVRLLGHAGSDIEFHYHTNAQIEAIEAQDPLLHSARIICEQNWLTPQEIIDLYETIRAKVNQASKRALLTPKLETVQEIMQPIIPPKKVVKKFPLPTEQMREQTFGKQFAQINQGKTLAQSINIALTDILLQYPNTVIFGEDVGKKGGVYRITADLQARFGTARVFDTLLDEQTILGTALGFAHNGYIPIPEIQFLAYTVNAFDQIRGEAATLSFFSKDKSPNRW